jgi:hypothetical protein
MRRSAAFVPIALALVAIILTPRGGAQAQSQQEGPIEIEKCRTIGQAGSYKLVRNLSTTTGDCLVITADFVTIDLAGFPITGANTTPSSTAVAIRAMPPSGQLLGIAVRNGSITGISGGGVDLGAADGSIVEGLRVVGTGFFGIVARGIVRGNTVTNVTSGIGVDATGTVTGNTADGNASGIVIGILAPFKASTVIGNTATDNSDFGILVGCPANITDNTAVNNSGGNLVLNGNGCNNTNNVAP